MTNCCYCVSPRFVLDGVSGGSAGYFDDVPGAGEGALDGALVPTHRCKVHIRKIHKSLPVVLGKVMAA